MDLLRAGRVANRFLEGLDPLAGRGEALGEPAHSAIDLEEGDSLSLTAGANSIP